MQLTKAMRNLHPTPPCQQKRYPVYVCDDLTACTHVFLRRDSVRRPLQQPYDGPYQVLSRKGKCYDLDINGREDRVSIDSLKPAYLETYHPSHIPPPSAVSPSQHPQPDSHIPTRPRGAFSWSTPFVQKIEVGYCSRSPTSM